MAFTKGFFLAVFAVALTLMLDQARAQCACTRIYYPLCDRYDWSDVVVRATASARNETGDDAIYTLDIITLYKAEDGGNYTDEISFTTPATYEDCGVTITLGEEYLMGLNGPNDDGVFTVPHCHGVQQLWSSVGTGGLDCGIDPCYGACGDYEECQVYEYNGSYYCSEICSDGACGEGETCTTQEREWCRNSRYLGCPTRRECS